MILVALGANIPSFAGAPCVTLQAALDVFDAQNIRVVKVSAFYSSPAWPNPSEPSFVNAVAAVETEFVPSSFLAALHAIEKQFGRHRERPNAPRTLDLDLLDYDGRVDDGWPILPHPRLATRAFVLVPLGDVAPDWHHPKTGQSLADLLNALPHLERQAVTRLAAARYGTGG